MHRSGFVHRDNTEGLQAFRTDARLADDARALVGGLKSVTAQRRDVEEDIRAATVLGDEAVALRDIEPFDLAGDLDEIKGFARDLGGL